MPKIDKQQIEAAAEAVCANWLAILGLKGAIKAKTALGRLLKQEKNRRQDTDG
jgi:hypothetical protein